MKRKTLSPRTRFEILKRDKFTCRYCGAKAPDVQLEVDHIKPVYEGGSNHPLNLVTSCEKCNGGKAAVPLSNAGAVDAARAEAENQQDKVEQIAQMAQWHDELTRLDDNMATMINGVLRDSFGFVLNPGNHVRSFVRLVKRQGLDGFKTAVLATEEWTDSAYGKRDPAAVFAKLTMLIKGGTARDNPAAGSAYIAGILRNRFSPPLGRMNALRADIRFILEQGEAFDDWKANASAADDLAGFLDTLRDARDAYPAPVFCRNVS